MIVIRGDLNEVNAHHSVSFCQSLQHFEHVIVQEASVGRRACAGRDGRAKGINIDGDIDLRPLRDPITP